MDYIRKTGKKTFGGLQLFSSVLSSKRSGDVMLFIFLFWSYIYMCVCGGIFYWYDRQKRHSILKAFEIKKKHFSFQPCEFRLPEDFTRNGNQIFLLNGIH